MQSKHIVFCHANGFVGGAYKPLTEALERAGHSVFAIDRIGHAQFPVGKHWQGLIAELCEHVEEQSKIAAGRPLVLVGHSLGAMLSFFVAHKMANKVSQYIMLDPPLINGPSVWLVRFVQLLGLGDKMSPAGRTIGRKQSWGSRQEAQAYFRSKALWRSWDEPCLEAFLDNALYEDDGKLSLRFKVDTEIDIYRNTPLNSDRVAANPVLKAALVTGEDSDVIFEANVLRMVKKHDMQRIVLPGGHMFPFEHPALTVETILQFIE